MCRCANPHHARRIVLQYSTSSPQMRRILLLHQSCPVIQISASWVHNLKRRPHLFLFKCQFVTAVPQGLAHSCQAKSTEFFSLRDDHIVPGKILPHIFWASIHAQDTPNGSPHYFSHRTCEKKMLRGLSFVAERACGVARPISSARHISSENGILDKLPEEDLDF